MQHKYRDFTKIERSIYWIIGLFCWSYPVYRLFLAVSSLDFSHSALRTKSLWSEQWSSDMWDPEISVLLYHGIGVFVATTTVQLVLAEILRKMRLTGWICILHFASSSIYLLAMLGYKPYCLIVAFSLAGFLASRFRSIQLAYLLPTAIYFGYRYFIFFFVGLVHISITPLNFTVVSVTIEWMCCRMLMYISDHALGKTPVGCDNLSLYLGYIFYGPMLKGPLHSFSDYISSFRSLQTTASPVKTRLQTLARNIVKQVFIFCLLQLMDHALPVRLFVFSHRRHAIWSHWELLGLSVWLGFYFFLKYKIAYGLAIQLAKFEGISTPEEPRCVLLITTYSGMWKYFDNGMYRFLLRYFYHPLMKSNSGTLIIRHIGATFCIFLYVFIWHGSNSRSFIWTCVNFVALSIEIIGKNICQSRAVKRWRNRMSVDNILRCKFLLISPLYIVSVAGQVSFLTRNGDIGWIAVSRLFTASLYDWITTIFMSYCTCAMVEDINTLKKR